MSGFWSTFLKIFLGLLILIFVLTEPWLLFFLFFALVITILIKVAGLIKNFVQAYPFVAAIIGAVLLIWLLISSRN